jgi:hypothetical protein
MTVFAKRMGSSFETISRFAAPGEPKFPGKKFCWFNIASKWRTGAMPDPS